MLQLQGGGGTSYGSEYYIRGCALVGFSEVVSALGGQPGTLLQRGGFSANAGADLDGLISWAGFGLLMESAADELGRRAFGLEWAASVPDFFPNFGPTLLTASFVETIEDWLRVTGQYFLYHTNAFDLELLTDRAEKKSTLRFSMQAPIPPARQQIEHIVGVMSRILRVVAATDEHPPPLLLRFRHQKPPSHEQFLGCPLEFDADHDEIVFDQAVLALRPSRALTQRGGILDRYIRHRVRLMSNYDQTMKTTVALAIRSMLGSGLCSSETAAQCLGMSSKKLQRLLARENTSFSATLDCVRRSIASRLLAETNASIYRIGGLLDYSTVAPFSLAFKRWTGLSPRAFRNAAMASSRDGKSSSELAAARSSVEKL